jgi:hypothetical protein
MRWTLRRPAGLFLPGETLAAYGEVVWTWRRDPGVYPVCLPPSLKLRRPSESVGPA